MNSNSRDGKSTARDLAFKVCKLIAENGLFPLTGSNAPEAKALAARALVLEAQRVTKTRGYRRAEALRRAAWRREEERQEREAHARRSRLGKLLALRNKVVKFLKDNYTSKTGGCAGIRQKHDIEVKLSGERLTLSISKLIWKKADAYSLRHINRTEQRRQAKQFSEDRARLLVIQKRFGGRLVKAQEVDDQWDQYADKDIVLARYQTLSLAWKSQ